MKEQGQVPGRTASGNRLDTAAAKKRCEAAMNVPCATCTVEIDGDGNAVHESDCVFAGYLAALEALEEACELLRQRPDGPWGDSGALDPSMSAEAWEEKVAAYLDAILRGTKEGE